MERYTIGVDFGTDSVRALLVNVDTGKVSKVSYYKRWQQGLYCEPANGNSDNTSDYMKVWSNVL